MSVSIHDVAKTISLSCETIIEALISPSSLEPEVVRHIMKHIRESGYLDTFLRWKGEKRTTSIAVLNSVFDSASGMEAFKGMDRVMSALGLNTSMVVLPTRFSSVYREVLLNSLISYEVIDCVVAMNIKPEAATLVRYADSKKPLILMHTTPPGVQSVVLENIKGTSIGINYLVRKGYRRIALVNGPTTGPETGLVPAERLMGYISAMQRAGLHFDDSLIVETADYEVDSGRQAFETFQKRGNMPDAVFCAAGDLTAIGFMKAALAAGLRVPEDIALIGYDDLPVASLVTPALTTIRQRLMIAGAAAVVLALESYVNGPGENLVIMPELVVRGTA